MWQLTPAEFGCLGSSGLWRRGGNDWVLSSCFTYRGIGQAKASNTSSLIYPVRFLLGKGTSEKGRDSLGTLYRRRYAQVPARSSSSVNCQLAVAPITYQNRQQSLWSTAWVTHRPHTQLVKVRLQRSSEHEEPRSIPWGTHLHSQDDLFLPCTNQQEKHRYFVLDLHNSEPGLPQGPKPSPWSLEMICCNPM